MAIASVSPIVSDTEVKDTKESIVAQVAAGTMSVDVALPRLAALEAIAPRPSADRITPPDSRPYRKTRSDKGILKLWCKWLPGKVAKGSGMSGAATFTPDDWKVLSTFAKSGGIDRMLTDYAAGTVQWSESYAADHPNWASE